MGFILRIFTVDIESKRIRCFTTECQITSAEFLPIIQMCY